MATCWYDGKLMAADQARVSVLDHGLLYGDGVFEGVRFYRRRVFLGEQHLDRLFESAKALVLTIPYSKAQLLDAMERLISSSGLEDGYIRLVVTRGQGALGIDPDSCEIPAVFMICDRVKMFSDGHAGLRLVCVASQKIPTACWDSRIKSLNYLNNVLARIQAKHAGADEALMLNQRGTIAEGAINNVFFVRRGQLCTPPVSDGALEGITRSLIMQLAEDAGFDVAERSLSVFDAYNAEECFLTGTGVELQAVASVDGRAMALCPGPVFQKLQAMFQDYVSGHDGCQQSGFPQAGATGGAI